MKKDIITEAYERQQIRILVESALPIAEAIIGSDDVILDQLFEEAMQPKSDDVFFFLMEELTDDEKYRADRMKGSGHDFYAQQFIGQHPEAEKAFYGEHRNWNDRRGSIRIPITLNTEGTPPHEGVKEHLSRYGYHVDSESYKKGIASRRIKVGNPSAGIPITEKTIHKRIGAVLDETNAHPDIKKAYINDHGRSGSGVKDFDLVLSHHPHDVYGMSTGRGWVSCSTMRKGCEKFNGQGPAAKEMQGEINGQTHIAYLVPKGGDVDKEAMGRFAFKRHNPIGGGKSTLIAENRVYGSVPPDFHKKAVEEVGKLFPVDPTKIYRRAPGTYDDSGRHFVFAGEHSVVKSSDLDAAWSTLGKKDDSAQRELYARVDPQQKYKSKTLNNIAKTVKNAHSYAKSGNFLAAHEELGNLDFNDTIDHYAITSRQPGSPIQKHLDEIADSFDHKNPEHVQLFKNLNQRHYDNGNHIQQEVVKRGVQKILYHTPIKTVSDAADYISLAQHDPNNKTMNFNLDEKHKLGQYPFNKIGHELANRGQLNPDTASRLFYGLKDGMRRGGNYYDHLSGLHKDNVPGSGELIQKVADDLKARNVEAVSAKTIYHTKPENRQQWSDVLGLGDHKELLKKHGPAIRAEEKQWKEIMAKRKAANANVT